MRKSVWLCGLLLALAVPAMAQEESPRFEVSGGYTYIRFNVKATPTGGGTTTSMGFNVNGGSGSVALNLNRWFGAVADLGYSKASPSFTDPNTGGKITTDESLFTYLFGPRISFRGSRWTPFAQALFGGARGSASAREGTMTIPNMSKNVFAFTVGGGLDANVSRHFAIRLIQAEYLYTNFNANGSGFTVPHQNNARLTFGVVIH